MSRPMRILYATPPGRLPTVTYDPGTWWDAIVADPRYDLFRHSLNFDWWTALLGPSFVRLLLEPLSPIERQHRRIAWRANSIDLESLAAAAAGSLVQLRSPAAYDSQDRYLDTLAPLAAFLDTVNRLQSEFRIDVDVGPHIRNLDYSDSRTLVTFSQSNGLLSRTIDAAMSNCSADYDVFFFSITSPEDLLTALMMGRKLKGLRPEAHISLIDHGYENFSLSGSIETLRARRTLEEVFDTIIATKDERDETVPALLEAIEKGVAPKGIIGRRDVAAPSRLNSGEVVPFQPLPTFSPEPILWTRVSKRRCYWSRCTFCSQNAKFDTPQAPAHSEILASLDRVAAYAKAGYKSFMFSDEAISPSSLNLLADEIAARGLSIKWACRSKMERAHTPDMFRRLGESGCFEILFGLETVSPRILSLMDKVTEGLDEEHIVSVLRSMGDAKVGVHVTLIAAFPGETIDEVRQTTSFIGKALGDCQNATFALNHFQLLPGTPIARAPTAFGLGAVSKPGDICGPLSFELIPSLADEGDGVAKAMPEIRAELDTALGWSQLEIKQGGALARHLYFYSGHGGLFKARSENPFANPLHQPVECAAG
jgi:hypothetical protein